MVVSLVSAIGNNLEEILQTPTQQPWVSERQSNSIIKRPADRADGQGRCYQNRHWFKRRHHRLGLFDGFPVRCAIELLCRTALTVIRFTFTSINQTTTSSRQLWAFARDK